MTVTVDNDIDNKTIMVNNQFVEESNLWTFDYVVKETDNGEIVMNVESSEFYNIDQNSSDDKLYNDTILLAAAQWLMDPNSSHDFDISQLGHISTWDVSGVTIMSELFLNALNFNDDINVQPFTAH